MMNECTHCNTHNPPQASNCRVCNLNLPRRNQPSIMHTTGRPKMAVFDLDWTLFDISRRERAAKRQGLKPGSDAWYEFQNQNKFILMDSPIPGTLAFVKALSDDGYTIAYLSGRPSSVLAATKESLQQNGYPIDALESDLVYLFSGKPSKKNITTFKKNILTHLKNSFDIHFFFDDTPEFREAAKSLFIPGVYPSIASYTGSENPETGSSKKTRKNPSEEPLLNPPPMPRKKRNKSGNMVKEPVKKYMSRFMADPKMNEEFPDNSQRFAVGLSYARKFYGDATVDRAYPPRSNPGEIEVLDLDPVPELSKVAHANFRKAAKLLDLNLKAIKPDYPGDESTALLHSAVEGELENPPVTGADATRYVKLKDMNTHKIKAHDYTAEKLQPFSLPVNLLSKLKSYLHGSREYIGFLEQTPKGKDDILRVGTSFGIGSAGYDEEVWDYMHTKPTHINFHTHPTRNNNAFGMNFDWQLPSGADYGFSLAQFLYCNVGIQLVVQKYGIHMIRPYVRPRSKLAKLLALPKSKFTKKVGEEVAELIKKDFKALRAVNTWKFYKAFIEKLGLDEFQMFSLEQSSDIFEAHVNSYLKSFAYKHDYFSYPIAGVKWSKRDKEGALSGEYSSVRANPGNVSEAKEMYKQFHQKAASNVQKKKVDFGDTWVGLGKAWSIGYRSGKETGNESQKYIHNFGVDEESGKQFKEPDLYYVKNNDGSQMMVIMGGDWYIDVDEEGKMSWIYI